MKPLLTAFAAMLLLSSAPALSQIIRVPQDHSTIQAAINAASQGDTIVVDEGTHNASLKIAKKIVLGSRFVIDGDTSHISKTILDGGFPRHVDSASVIEIVAGTDSTTVISGFTITEGTGMRRTFSGQPDWRTGGGISIGAGAARISHNIIVSNTLDAATAGVYGGGISIDAYYGPLGYWIIENNVIKENIIHTTRTTAVGAEGGGVWVTGNGRFTNNVVSGNSASASVLRSYGGGVNIIGMFNGGASNIPFENNVILGNQALIGGGLAMYAVANGTGWPSVDLINNIIVGNTSTDFGSAIDVNSGAYYLVNNTIANNIGDTAITLGNGRGLLTFKLLNNIVWNPPALHEFNFAERAIGFNNIVRTGLAGPSNLTSDPLFVVGDSLPHLSSGSPAIGGGILSVIIGSDTLNAPSRDLFGMNRPMPSQTNPDMGAIEELATGVGSEEAIPLGFSLEQNFPNPFNPSTRFSYFLPLASHISLKVFDLLGREVAVLVNEAKPAGDYAATWDASGMPSGVYYFRMNAGEFTMTKRMVLLR